VALGGDLQRLSLLNDTCDLLFREVLDIESRLHDASLTDAERREATELLAVKREVLKEMEHERVELRASIERQRRTLDRSQDRERDR